MPQLFSLVIMAILLVGLSTNQCQNGGKLILVRKKQMHQIITYACLCPYTYFGAYCENFRDIYCRFSNQKVIKYNPKQSQTAHLQFDFDCYLKKLNQNATELSSQKNNFYKLPITQPTIKQQLKQLNYYVDQSFQIIWANDSSLFENNGELIRDANDNRTDDQILDSYPVYEFEYMGDFYGVPLRYVDVIFNLTVVSFTKNSTYLTTPAIQFMQIPQPGPGQPSFRNIGSLSIEIKQQWQQFNVARLQLLTSLHYGDDEHRLFHRLGMNSAKWRIFNPVITKGTILQPTTSKVPPSFCVILAFISIFVLIYGGRLAVRLYKKYKNSKNIKYIHADDEEPQDNKDEE